MGNSESKRLQRELDAERTKYAAERKEFEKKQVDLQTKIDNLTTQVTNSIAQIAAKSLNEEQQKEEIAKLQKENQDRITQQQNEFNAKMDAFKKEAENDLNDKLDRIQKVKIRIYYI